MLRNSRRIGDINQRPFRETLLDELRLPETLAKQILDALEDAGLLEEENGGYPDILAAIARDFTARPEAFSSLLMSDFGLKPVVAHQVRAGVMGLLQTKQETKSETNGVVESANLAIEGLFPTVAHPQQPVTCNATPATNNIMSIVTKSYTADTEQPTMKRPAYKAVIVNPKARLRQATDSKSGSVTQSCYGLPPNYKNQYPRLAKELDDLYSFMTRPSTSSQDECIRPATANVYLKHAKLFLGWYVATHKSKTQVDKRKLSLFSIFPNRERNSADPVLDFVLWLRSSRQISVSYEANILRGLSKVLKFRFAEESQSDPSYGEKSFDDIPLIREVRKLHRDANKRQKIAPRVSDESQKWLSWPEYLQVVKEMQQELVGLLDTYKATGEDANRKAKIVPAAYSPMQRKIAVLYQKYLILAIFTSVPDRQRTIRELEIGRSLLKDEASGCWCIKHAPDDYKTGKAYGERPLLQLSSHLTDWIDNFLDEWRQCLLPRSQTLFVQVRTGNPLTQDSVYQIVSRSCYRHTGKRTNPHLLRDMLVTHVREANASEKQLEALALYMGHSIQTQRSSYDRRTLTRKVAPAVELMQFVNNEFEGRTAE